MSIARIILLLITVVVVLVASPGATAGPLGRVPVDGVEVPPAVLPASLRQLPLQLPPLLLLAQLQLQLLPQLPLLVVLALAAGAAPLQGGPRRAAAAPVPAPLFDCAEKVRGPDHHVVGRAHRLPVSGPEQPVRGQDLLGDIPHRFFHIALFVFPNFSLHSTFRDTRLPLFYFIFNFFVLFYWLSRVGQAPHFNTLL